jgi:hypothetical protein
VPARVGNEVGERSAQQGVVDHDGRVCAGHLGAGRRGLVREHVEDVDGRGREGPSFVERGEQDEVVDARCEASGEVVQAVPRGGIDAIGIVGRELEFPLQRHERRAELVRGI